MSIVMETERCVLTELHASDVDHMVQLQTDADVYRYLGGPKQESDVREGFLAAAERGFSPHSWAVRSKDTDAFIGWVTLSEHHDGEDTELSYLLLPDWWGQGYAFEATQALVDYALTELNLPRIVAETQSANKRSLALLERLGMKLERTVERFGAEQSFYTTV